MDGFAAIQEFFSTFTTVYNFSVDETATAVQKLINDKKNGAVMQVFKKSADTPLVMQYMEYKWTPVENK